MTEEKKKNAKLKEVVKAYLATLSDTDGERRYLSFKRYAETEIGSFLVWLDNQPAKKKNNTPARNGEE